MTKRKIVKQIITLFNFKFLLIGLLLSVVFLKLNNLFKDNFTGVITIIFLIYLCFGFAYRINKYFKKDHFLLNIFILIFISGILYLAIKTFIDYQVNIPILSNFLGDAVWFYALIVLISVVLVLIKLIVNLIFTFVKKRVDIVKLILAIIFLFTSIFIFYPPLSMKNDAIKFYYQTLNPKAGMIYYEKQFKKESEKAEGYRAQVNTIMTKLQENEQGQKSDEYLLTLLKGKKSQTDEIFNNRKISLQKLIDIDTLGQNIRLPKNQKQFYEKRKLADENELKAFSIYKLAQERFTDGGIEYYGFWNLFYKAVNSAYSQDPALRTVENVNKLEKEINDFYNIDVKKSQEQKILSDDVFKRIDHGYKTVTKLFEYQKFRAGNPSAESIKQKEQELTQVIKNETDNTQSNTDLFAAWIDSDVKLGIFLQDKIHQNSFSLYKDAYGYAKKQKMDAIFTVWKNDYPGYEKPQTEQVTLNNSKEAVEGYYRIYQNPMVIYVRTALNAYLQGDPQKTIPDIAKVKSEDEKYTYGLDSFDKKYYQSKFVVILKDDNTLGGGNYFTIMFQDKPDKFFTTWIYQLADKTYEMRGFWSLKKQSAEDIKKVNTEFKQFLIDKEHSM